MTMKPIKLTPLALELIRKAEAKEYGKELSKMTGAPKLPTENYHPDQATPKYNLDRYEGNYFEQDSDNNL